MPIDVTVTPQGLLVQPIPSTAIKLSDATPMPETLAPTPGSGAQATRADHQHERSTSATTNHVLDANGEATIVFTRTFVDKPSTTYMLDEAADLGPIIMKVKSWATNAQGHYTGCVVKGYRGRLLPATIALLSALVSYDVFAGSVNGAVFSFIALKKS